MIIDETTTPPDPHALTRFLFTWGKARRLAAHGDVPVIPASVRPESYDDDETPRVISDPVAYGRRALDAAVDQVRYASEGMRNHTLNANAYSLGRLVGGGLLDEATVIDTLTTAAGECGLGGAEIARTLSSGLYSGMARPRRWVHQPKGAGPATASTAPSTGQPGRRPRLKLTKASNIAMRPVHWLWGDRLPLGELALLGGREGIGKSTIAYTLAADITRGRLHGRNLNVAKAVIVAATEDSWEHTIVPRLTAADADLDLVYRTEVDDVDDIVTGLVLPRDIVTLAEQVRETDAALILLDPIMSRLDTTIDSHKDADVRRALEPLVRLGNDTGATVLGLIHVNKSASTDPLTMLMGSRAFAAVARAVLFVMVDPENESVRLLGQPKNNLGRTNLPTKAFTIEGARVAETAEGPVTTGKAVWLPDVERSIADALATSGEDGTLVADAAHWLRDYLTQEGGEADSADIKRDALRAGHSVHALSRARARARVTLTSHGFPRRTTWQLDTSPTVSER